MSSSHVLTCSSSGRRHVWRLVSRVSCCAGLGGAGTLRIIGEQALFCTEVFDSVSLACPDIDVPTVTALYLV